MFYSHKTTNFLYFLLDCDFLKEVMLFQPIFLPAKQFADGQSFLIYRGDLECKTAPGNKQHKLKYHLQQALSERKTFVATFGGPHSNHIAAFVSRCVELGVKPVIVVRGEVWANLTPTLKQAVNLGAILFPSQRTDYRLGLLSHIKQTIDTYCQGDVYWVPEGGAGPLGVLGCLDWANDIYRRLKDDDTHVCLASGTGATAAGFAASNFKSLSVFSALKGADNLVQQIQNQCYLSGLPCQTLLKGFDEALHGGFGRTSDALLSFLGTLKILNPDIPLDPVYTSKMVFKVNQLLEQGCWPYKKTLFIHTGGLQGWQGLGIEKCPYDHSLFR